MWPCVAVSEICCFQLARGLSKVAACPTTSHVPPPPPPPSRFTSWALGSNHLSGTPAWVLGHQTGHSVRLWVLCARPPACPPRAQKSGPQPGVLPDPWLLCAQHCSGNCTLHPAPSPRNVTLIQVSLPVLGNSQREGPNQTGEAAGSRTWLPSRRGRGGDMRHRDVSRPQLDLIQTKPTT